MKRNLVRTNKLPWHTRDGKRVEGTPSGLSGNCSRLSGDCSRLSGNCSWCELTTAERKAGVNIANLVGEEAV